METKVINNVEKIERNSWGAITNAPEPARKILEKAIEMKIIEKPRIKQISSRRNLATNHDIYDYIDNAILIQTRQTEITKHYKSTKKDYYILINMSNTILKIEAPHKMMIAKTAKLGLPAGSVIKRICGTTDSAELFARLYVIPKLQGQNTL